MQLKKQAVRLAAVAAAVAAALTVSACSPSAETGDSSREDLTAVTVSVGRQPYAAGNSPVSQYMIENELFEKAAADYGIDLTVQWQDFPTAAPQVEAMVADRLDIGMWGNTPVVRAIAQDQPISVIGVGEGHMRFVLVTREGSEISDIADLEGKTLGVTIGADPHLALLQMLAAELGSTDLDQLGITLVNMPTQAASAQVPSGVDATVTNYPSYLTEKAKNDEIVAVANSFGETEEGYEGSLGKGEGHAYASAEESVFAPEGFYAHRSFWVARDAFIEEHPDVISAFTQALQEAITALGEDSDTDIAALVTEYWGDPETASAVVDDELLFQRGWAWATNGDGQVLMKLSEKLAEADVIDTPLTWEATVGVFEVGADAVGAGYEISASAPAADQFSDTSGSDSRGAPQWQLAEWTAP